MAARARGNRTVKRMSGPPPPAGSAAGRRTLAPSSRQEGTGCERPRCVPVSPPRMSKNQPAQEGSTERRVVDVDDTSLLLALTGPQSELLKLIARETGAEVGQRGNSILLSGQSAQVDLAERFLAET